MNRLGFTLPEVLVVLVLISLVSVFVIMNFGSTLSIGKNESYQLMKNNILLAGNNYINDCRARVVDCDFYNKDSYQFSSGVLLEKGYLKSLNSPLDGEYLGDCLYITYEVSNGVYIADLLDRCY